MLSRLSPSNLLLIVLCGVLFLDGLDVSMVGVALPSIDADLHLTTSQLQWIVSGYVLGYGGLLLLGGRTADLLGRRRTLLIALGVFTFASALGGLVDDGTLLVVTRFLKGAAAAFTAPAGLSIITTTFAEGPARNRALSIYTACGASGFSLGLVLGGLLTEVGWRWTFLLPVPIAAAILLALPRFAPDDTPSVGERRSYDFPRGHHDHHGDAPAGADSRPGPGRRLGVRRDADRDRRRPAGRVRDDRAAHARAARAAGHPEV